MSELIAALRARLSRGFGTGLLAYWLAPAHRSLAIAVLAMCALLTLVGFTLWVKLAVRQGPPRARVPFAVAVGVTALVVLASAAIPADWVATAIASIFLIATGMLVWRREDARVLQFGLALSGLVTGGVGLPTALAQTARNLLWALCCALVCFAPFAIAFPQYWGLGAQFNWHRVTSSIGVFGLGQVLVVAFPEEAFYRGYVQSAFDEAMPARTRVFGAEIGWSIVLTSALFAIGHFATIPQLGRLAVFFPSLLFGWLRARTKDVTAGIFFHAFCNIFAEILARGYGLYGTAP